MYEFKPAPGVKVRRIVTLADDSHGLTGCKCASWPNPRESVVGIEIQIRGAEDRLLARGH